MNVMMRRALRRLSDDITAYNELLADSQEEVLSRMNEDTMSAYVGESCVFLSEETVLNIISTENL